MLYYMYTLWYLIVLNKICIDLLCSQLQQCMFSEASCVATMTAGFGSFLSCPRIKGIHAIFKAYIFTCSCIDNLKVDLVPCLQSSAQISKDNPEASFHITNTLHILFCWSREGIYNNTKRIWKSETVKEIYCICGLEKEKQH